MTVPGAGTPDIILLGQCASWDYLDLYGNGTGEESFAGVLGRCPALTHLNLILNLSLNHFGAAGVKSLTRVLAQCTGLSHLNLSYNGIGDAGTERLAGLLGQCPVLTHLDLSDNNIGTGGTGGFELCVVVNPLSLFWRTKMRTRTRTRTRTRCR